MSLDAVLFVGGSMDGRMVPVSGNRAVYLVPHIQPVTWSISEAPTHVTPEDWSEERYNRHRFGVHDSRRHSSWGCDERCSTIASAYLAEGTKPQVVEDQINACIAIASALHCGVKR